MRGSFLNAIGKYFSNCFHQHGKRLLLDGNCIANSISQKSFSKKTQAFINDLKIRDLMHHSLPSIDANELIIDSLKSFQHPFKMAVLILENTTVVGSLKLVDVIANLNACKDLKSGFCSEVSIRCIMNDVFVPLEYDSCLSEVVIDILNCESLIHPVYDNGKLKGVIYKETILDILKIQMLEDAVLI